jgi:UDP-glucose 4-epimerase
MFNLPSRMVHGALQKGRVDFSSGAGGIPHEEDAFDLCYVTHCATAIYQVHSAKRLNHRINNVGAGRATSNQEIKNAVIRSIPTLRLC